MRQLSNLGTAKYVTKFMKIIMEHNKPNATPDEQIELGVSFQLEITNLINEIWNHGYGLGHSEGKKVGLFENKEN